MRLRAALSRALFAAFVLVAPPLLYGASVRAALARDVAALAGTEPPPREAVVARVAACGPCGVDVLIEALAGPTPVPAMNLLRAARPDAVVPPLVAALDDRDEDVRHGAGMALAYIGADAVPALVEARTCGTGGRSSASTGARRCRTCAPRRPGRCPSWARPGRPRCPRCRRRSTTRTRTCATWRATRSRSSRAATKPSG